MDIEYESKGLAIGRTDAFAKFIHILILYVVLSIQCHVLSWLILCLNLTGPQGV